jgi:cytochrome c oxidase subunit I
LLAAILFFVAGLFSFNSAIDIRMHDTYFISRLSYFIWTPSIVLLFFWLIYLATRNILFSKRLMWIHVFLTILTCIFILTFPYFLTNSFAGLAGMPRRYFDIGQSKTYQFFGELGKTGVALVVILALGQLTFLTNFFVGLYKNETGRNNR